MTYLNLVNNVLMRLREPNISSVSENKDPVVNIVKMLVNDAKRYVESAHQWNATRYLWRFGTEKNKASYVLDGTKDGARITGLQIYYHHIDQWDLKAIINGGPRFGEPHRYAWEGTDDEGNIMLRLDPIPVDVYAVEVLGWRNLPDLQYDSDFIRIPSQPVLYYALALSARERGEVGGQTAQELFGMADKYISDAIALDATLSPTEFTWEAV